MHLVFLNQYYPPDAAPTGVMLEGVVEKLVRDGHEVTVLCASGGYAGREQVAESGEYGVASKNASTLAPRSVLHAPCSFPRIIRLRASRFGRGTFVGKLLDYASYYVGVAWKLSVMQSAPDRIVALTTPPLLSVLARLLSKIRGADHAHWVMDLYPDVMAAHGMLVEKSMVYRMLAGLARWGFGGRRRAAVLTLGPDMAERVERLVLASNVEHRTSNVERRREDMAEAASMDTSLREMNESRDESRGPETAENSPNNQQSTINNHQSSILSASLYSQPSTLNSQLASNPQLSPVQWVPLWAADCSGVSATVAGCPSGREGGSDAFESDFTAGLPQLCPLGESATVADAPLQAASAALRLKRGWADRELIVMYSGNMGLGHRFGEILEVAGGARVSSPAESMEGESSFREESGTPFPGISFAAHRPCESGDSRSGQGSPNAQRSSSIRFVFYGGGKRRAEVADFVKANPGAAVEVHDYAPAEELTAHLQSADVHLASLDAAWTGTMVPSKLQGIFAAGRPVIFIGSAESSIGRWVAESGGGWVVPPGDVDGLLAALDEARDPGTRLTRGRAAKTFADTHFDRQTNIARVAAILASPLGGRDIPVPFHELG